MDTLGFSFILNVGPKSKINDKNTLGGITMYFKILLMVYKGFNGLGPS